ncbi:protein scabrous [Euwallacea fornicatus]|uniref:protein scabrous n=1 Tax=Euwallacea fornicatus TaxID=995702 RepID=UPI00338E1FFF
MGKMGRDVCGATWVAFVFIASVSLYQTVTAMTVTEDELIKGTNYDLRVLSKQVKALVERRTEDLKSIEESVRRTVFNGPEVEELRDQVRSLKNEIELLRSGSGSAASPPPETKNDKLTVKWLTHSMEEIKTEISELQSTVNSSALLRDHEVHEAQMRILQSDISSLNGELEQFRRLNAKKDAELNMLKEEFNNMKNDWRSMAETNGRLRNQLRSVQLEWAHNYKALLEKQLPPLSTNNSTHNHQKALRHHVLYLEKFTKSLHKENSFLKYKLSKIELQLQQFNPSSSVPDYITTNQIPEGSRQMTNITAQQLVNTETIANLSKQMSDFDKLHMSMLELLENVETLENKVDSTLPEFRKEISKMENMGGKMGVDLAQLKEEQRNVKESMQAIGFSVSKLQDARDKLEGHISALEKSAVVQNSRLHDHILKEEFSTKDLNATKSTIHLVEELQSFESEYKSIVNKLPRDCGSVEGLAGIYLISPGDGEPILAYCNEGWTTVQRRHDGSLNFNRNWNEYSNGFGSATGEHWMGNRNLHHLTRDNCSMLRINMKDIYGKYWEASYEHFFIGDYTQGFRLHVAGYRGNASDAMDYQNRMEFSTVDNDRDISNTHCASNYEGGWWFSHCQHANLNGRYNLGLTWFDSARNEWIAVAQSEMHVKRREVC